MVYMYIIIYCVPFALDVCLLKLKLCKLLLFLFVFRFLYVFLID